MIKATKIIGFLIFALFCYGCAPWDELTSHDFDNDYYRLKSPDKETKIAYVKRIEDSIIVYPVSDYKSGYPDTVNCFRTSLKLIDPRNQLYNSTLVRTSFDFDLSTALLKLRPAAGDVPTQLSANLNGLVYGGFRTDYFKFKTTYSELNEISTSIRHTGFDFGFFAGIGITPVNPTVTMGETIQEYDGIVFQKGIAFFVTYANMSVGISLGFDNLLDKNKNIWIYNNKPWIGLVLGIANF